MRHYVVLAGSIGSFCHRGEVVTEKFLLDQPGVTEDRIRHFEATGAVREASNLEAKYDKISLDDASTVQTAESRLAAAERRVEALLAENRELQSEIQDVKAVQNPAGPPVEAKRFDELVARKDMVISELQAKVKELEKAAKGDGKDDGKKK